MELRSCRSLHFIAAIKGGSVAKLRNVDSRGNPSLMLKHLKEIYESEDAKYSRSTSQDRYGDSAFSYNRVKIERLCLPVVDRSLQVTDHATDKSVCHGDDDERGSDSDDSVTLKQLKERCKTKKMNLSRTVSLNLNQGHVKFQGGDDFDLEVTLSTWKLKHSKKRVKAKRKHMNEIVSKSELALSIKSEPVLCPEDTMQANGDLKSLTHIKTEDLESEFLESPSPIACFDDPFPKDISYEIPKIDECNNRQLIIFTGQYPKSSLNKVYHDAACGECDNCAVHEVCYDHLEPCEPIALHLAKGEEIVQVSNNDYGCESFLSPEHDIEENSNRNSSWESSLNISLPVNDQSSEFCSCSNNSSYLNEISRQPNWTSGVQALGMSVDMNDKDSIPVKDNTDEEGRNLMIWDADARKGCQNPGDPFASINDSSPNSGEQPLVCRQTNPERSSCLTSQTSSCTGAGADSSSNSVQLQTPQRLPSKRKAISPNSQEQLCSAMDSEELYDEMDFVKCKEKLYLSKQVERKAVTVSLNFLPASRAENSVQSGQLNRAKFLMRPSQIPKKSKNEKRGFPPKGNLEGPRFSRSVPNMDTGCTSIKGCSESAITFAQRQMQDIESLAVRLVNELSSMKDIVEQKLLFESYRNISLKNDADEVRTAIKNATTTEETARKWLSTMARDCNRFCKIMRLTQNGSPALKNEVQRKRKKIRFADEAGEMLCHVKYFENGMSSPESSSMQQKDQV